MKEHLVTQLKTQISDLERFIEFLQGTNIFCSTWSLITSACVSPPHFTSCFCAQCPVCVSFAVMHWKWMRKSCWWFWSCGMLHFVIEWVVCCVLKVVPWLCLYTVVLFPVLTALHALLDSQHERTAGLWNIINHSPDHMMSLPVRLESSALPPWEPQISFSLYCTS